MDPFHWTCPYCDRDTTIVGENCSWSEFVLSLNAKDGDRKFTTQLIVCPNQNCRNFALKIAMSEYMYQDQGPGRGFWKTGKLLRTWNLIPSSNAKVFPDYIPKAIRDDYEEACLIRDLSPKASATLSRRCLQGMIRNFWGIQKPRLIDEVEALKDKIDPETWASIDAVRTVGNIGAHMEKDINVIVDVEPNEAQLLIGLIEMLIKDWYLAKHDREERLKQITALAAKKGAAKALPSSTPTP